MTQLISHDTALSVGQHPLTSFGLGVGVHLDTDVDSTDPDPSTLAFLRGSGVTRYRLNVRWSAIKPEPGDTVDDATLDRLGVTIERLRDAGIEPLVALDNVSVPAHLDADGGWRNAATAHAYGDFVGAVGSRLGDLVDEWVTVAAARPRQFSPSMTANLIAAQTDAASILRAHAPHALLGASVDIAQVDNLATPADARAAEAWISHLASPQAATNFIALNVDQPGHRSPSAVAQTIRVLAHHMPDRSFVITEARSTAAGPHLGRSSRLVDIDGPEHHDIVDQYLEQIQLLRNSQIDVNGTFVWPFAGPNPAHESLTATTTEGYQRNLAERIT